MLGEEANKGVAAVQFAPVDQLRAVECVVGQAQAQGFGQMLGQQAHLVGAACALQRRAQAHAGALQKALHVGLGAQGLLLFVPFGQHFVGADAALREHGAVGFGFFQRVLPLGLQRREQALGFAEVEGFLPHGWLRTVFAAHQRGLDQGLVDAGVVFGQGHHDAQFALDGFALAQDDLEHEAVDGVVLPVEHGAAHFGRLLAEAVYPAFALLVARGVPGQVVVDDGGEQVLQVDAFRKAIGSHEDAAVGICHVFDPLAALFGREFAGDGVDGGLGEGGFEMFGHVVRGGDVAAEHDGVVAITQQLAHVLDERGELGVALLAREALGGGDERLQARCVLHLRGGLQVAAGEVVGLAIVQAFVGQQVFGGFTAFQAGGEGLDGCRWGRGHAAQQGQGGVPHEAGAACGALAFGGFREFAAVVLHGVEEVAPVAAELVGQLGFHAPCEASAVFCFGLPFGNVFAAALHEVAGQFLAQRVAGGHAALQGGKARVQQGQKVVERCFIARVGRGGEQDQVAVRVAGQALQQFEAQLLACAAAGAGVGFVHDDAFRRGGDELLAVALALDVVQAYHHDGVVVEQGHTMRQFAFHPCGRGGGEGHGVQVEAFFQLGLPLLHQVWWAKHGQAGDFATIHQFTGNETGFDGFANAYVVGDQKAHGGQAQRHQQRHQLVAARLYGDVAERPEGARTCAQGQAQRIA